MEKLPQKLEKYIKYFTPSLIKYMKNKNDIPYEFCSIGGTFPYKILKRFGKLSEVEKDFYELRKLDFISFFWMKGSKAMVEFSQAKFIEYYDSHIVCNGQE